MIKIPSNYRHDPANVNSISNDHVISIIQVSKNILALGFHEGGFDFFNIQTGRAEHDLPDTSEPNSLSIADVNNLFKDRQGNIWIRTWGGGLNCYNIATKKYKHYRYSPGDSTSISSDIVTTVFQDSRDQIWVGTYNGLNKLDKSGKYFRRYRQDHKYVIAIA